MKIVSCVDEVNVRDRSGKLYTAMLLTATAVRFLPSRSLLRIRLDECAYTHLLH